MLTNDNFYVIITINQRVKMILLLGSSLQGIGPRNTGTTVITPRWEGLETPFNSRRGFFCL